MKVKFINDKATIEGLTFRQLALIESLVNEASRAGGYQIDKVKIFREQFSMIQQCKDDKVKAIQLRDLMNEMENRFSIPVLKNEKYNQANPEVMRLYLEVGNARVF